MTRSEMCTTALLFGLASALKVDPETLTLAAFEEVKTRQFGKGIHEALNKMELVNK